MKILIFLSIVALGKATEQFSTNSKYSETLNGYQPLSVSSFSGNSDFNTHVSSNFNSGLHSGSFGKIPVSSTIQGQSLNTHLPVFNHGLHSADSSVTGTGFLSSSGSYSSGQHQNVQPLFSGAETGSPNGFSAHVLPNSIQYHAVSSTSSPTSYVNPTSLPGSFSLTSVPVQGQDSSFKTGSKTVEIISDEGDNKAVSSNGSPFNGQYSSIVTNNSAAFSHSPTVSTQKPLSTNFFNEKSDTVLASRFLSDTDQNDGHLSKPNLTSNYNTFVSTDSPTTAKPLSSTPTASPTPYTTTPLPTTAFSKTNFKTVTTSSYPSTTFKTYSAPLYNNFNTFYSTSKPLNTYSRVFSTAVPITTPVSTSVTPAYFAPTTFKTYSTPLYNNYNPIYSTPKPLNTYSRVFSTAVPVTTPVSTTITPTYFTPTTFKSYSTPLYNNYNSFYSTPKPFNTYSRVFSTPAPATSSTIKSSSVSNGASQAVNNFFKPAQYVPSVIKKVSNTYSPSVTTQSPADVTSFNPVTFNRLSSGFSKPYLSGKQSSSHFTVSSTPAPFNTTSPSFSIFKPSASTASPTPYSVSVTTPFPQVKFKTVSSSPYSSTTFKPYSSSSPVPYSFNTIYSTPKTFDSYPKVFSTPVSVVTNVTSFNPVTSKYVSNIFSKPYSADAKSSLYSNVFPSPNTPSSPSFPILASAAPISPTPYSVAVTTPASTSAFLKENFQTVTPTPYTSTTFKPFSTTALPYSIYSTPKTLNSYFSTSSTTPAPAVSNTFKFSSALNGVSQTLNSGKSSIVTASQSLKPNVDLTSRFDPVYVPVSHASVSTTPRPIETYSITYPKSRTIDGSSFGFNSESVISQTPGQPPVVFPFNNINSGVYTVPALGQHSYYSGNLSPTFKVSEKTLYSPPVPISFSSLSSKSEFYPVPAQLSYPSVYSSTYGKNVGLSSVHDVHSAVPFGYSVKQAPLTKEYHTVEEPIVKTWKSIDSWNVAPVSHFETHFS